MLEAQCCCGSLKIAVTGEPVLNAVCHCANCKRRTGSGFGWQCYFPEDAVAEPSGEAGVYEFVSQSGVQRRHFCSRCGGTVFWRAAAFPGVVGVAGGCLPPDCVPAPTVCASNDGRCSWLTLPEGMIVYG